MSKWTLPIVVVTGAMVAAGCGSQPRAGDESGERGQRAERRASGSAEVVAEPVELLQVVRGEHEALRRGGVTLVKDEAGLQSMGLDSIEGLSPNWDEQDVVILALGEQNSGGFWADIKGIQLVGQTLYVQGVVNRPEEEAAATQALTHPYAAAVISETSATRAQGDYEELVGQPLPE